MANKENIKQIIKLAIEAGKANPAPPVGPALGAAGVNIMDFCKSYNEKTKDSMGQVIPVVITVYKDGKFDFILKSPPASRLILKALKRKKGAHMPGRETVAKITVDQLKEIAEIKKDDLNSNTIEAAVKIIAGTAKRMGIEVIES